MNPRRHLTLHGSREQALEYLPAFCPDERLELGGGRISLVGERARVDVRIVAATGSESGHDEIPLLLLEIAFEGRTEPEADAFVRRYRHRARLGTHCH